MANFEYPEVHMGRIIQQLLRKKGASNDEFSRAMDVALTHVPRIFKQKTIPLKRLRAISNYLEYDLCALLPSKKTQEFIQKGKGLDALQAELNDAHSIHESHKAELDAQASRFQAEIEQKEREWSAKDSERKTELAALQAELVEEKENRLEAEIQVRVLEGKLEILMLQQGLK